MVVTLFLGSIPGHIGGLAPDTVTKRGIQPICDVRECHIRLSPAGAPICDADRADMDSISRLPSGVAICASISTLTRANIASSRNACKSSTGTPTPADSRSSAASRTRSAGASSSAANGRSAPGIAPAPYRVKRKKRRSSSKSENVRPQDRPQPPGRNQKPGEINKRRRLPAYTGSTKITSTRV